MIEFFTPNRNPSKDAMRLLIVTQLAIAFAVWFFSPFVYLPRPGETFAALGELWQDGLGTELITSLALNFEALLVATILSLALAYASRLPVMRPIVTLIGKLRFLSMAGLTFVFTLMTKNGQQLKVSLLVFSVAVFFVTGMADVIASIPQEQYDLARTLRMNEWRVMLEVVIFGQADQGFNVMRQNAAVGWMMLTMVESMARSGGGIGTVLTDQNRHFHLAAVFAIQLVILGCGLAQDYSIGLLRRWFCPWADMMLERK